MNKLHLYHVDIRRLVMISRAEYEVLRGWVHPRYVRTVEG